MSVVEKCSGDKKTCCTEPYPYKDIFCTVSFFTKHKCSSDYLRCQMTQIRQEKYASADLQQIFKGEDIFFSHQFFESVQVKI